MGIRLLFALVLSALLSGGCQRQESTQKKGGHGEPQPAASALQKGPGMVSVVRKTGFDGTKSLPVGKAIDEYGFFSKRAWQETDAKNGTIYVDFIGELDPGKLPAVVRKIGVVARSVDIKFVAKTNGDCFVGMITLSDTKKDGKAYPVQVTDIAGVMNAIYANKELPQQ